MNMIKAELSGLRTEFNSNLSKIDALQRRNTILRKRIDDLLTELSRHEERSAT